MAAGARVLVAGSAVFGAVKPGEELGFDERVARYAAAIAAIRRRPRPPMTRPPRRRRSRWGCLIRRVQPPRPVRRTPAPPVDLAASAAPATASPVAARPGRDAAARAEVRAMLARVVPGARPAGAARGASRVLDRDRHPRVHPRARGEGDVPRDVIEDEGELLAALELVPPDYDFVEGTYKLIQGRIAGFYEPADRTMYLVDDLSDDEATETLAHELDHALQDQTFPLAAVIEFAPGDGDRTAAAHALIEGDAMSAMFDVIAGLGLPRQRGALRTPARGLQRHVRHGGRPRRTCSRLARRALRRRLRLRAAAPRPRAAGPPSTRPARPAGDHRAAPPPRQVRRARAAHPRRGPPTFAALGAGFRAVLDDVMGEQGLRLMLGEWTGGRCRRGGAAGWGGDRYVVARVTSAAPAAVSPWGGAR